MQIAILVGIIQLGNIFIVFNEKIEKIADPNIPKQSDEKMLYIFFTGITQPSIFFIRSQSDSGIGYTADFFGE